jgi:hypothetical protein
LELGQEAKFTAVVGFLGSRSPQIKHLRRVSIKHLSQLQNVGKRTVNARRTLASVYKNKKINSHLLVTSEQALLVLCFCISLKATKLFMKLGQAVA